MPVSATATTPGKADSIVFKHLVNLLNTDPDETLRKAAAETLTKRVRSKSVGEQRGTRNALIKALEKEKSCIPAIEIIYRLSEMLRPHPDIINALWKVSENHELTKVRERAETAVKYLTEE